MRTFNLALAIAFTFCVSPAFAQTEEDVVRLQAAMAAAQAEAARPGDESLNCEALQTEMVAVMQDPAVQTQMAQTGAIGQEMQQELNAANERARAQMAANMFMGMAAGFVSSFVPGAGYAAMAAQRAQMADQMRQAEQNRQRVSDMLTTMEPIIPQMMRGQRVYELAQARQCEFVQQAPAAQ